MENINEKLLETIFNYNKRSLLNLIQISLIASVLNMFLQLYLNQYISLVMIVIYLGLINKIELLVKKFQFEDMDSLNFYFRIVYYSLSLLISPYLLMNYLLGLGLGDQKIYFYLAVICPYIIFAFIIFENKMSYYASAIIYSCNIVFVVDILYYLYGYEEFCYYFSFIDIVLVAYMILTLFSNISNKIQYFDDYSKLLFENDLNHKKFTSTFKNQITPSIQINKNNYSFEYSYMFIEFFRKIIDNDDYYNGFFDTSNEEMEKFINITKLTNEYINFYKKIAKSKQFFF